MSEVNEPFEKWWESHHRINDEWRWIGTTQVHVSQAKACWNARNTSAEGAAEALRQISPTEATK